MDNLRIDSLTSFTDLKPFIVNFSLHDYLLYFLLRPKSTIDNLPVLHAQDGNSA